jgi:hypothetical protein
MRVLSTTPKERLEAFRLLRVFPDTNPEMLETCMLLRVFPRIKALFTIPNKRLEAFKFARPEALEPIRSPSIVRPVRVPTDVIFG